MNPHRGIRVTCPECDLHYRLPDASLLPIARCGRCYGAVEAETARDPAAAAAVSALPARS